MDAKDKNVVTDEENAEAISDFISRVYSDFEKYINGQEKLCDLKKATFYGDRLPDYTNEHVQQVYLLRYCLAYAYEYKRMYETVFLRGGFSPKVEVVSIGCGSMLDYWSCAEVVNTYGDYSIDYTGIDLNDWKYKIEKRKHDVVRFLQQDVVDWLYAIAGLTADIVIFPKSISEFSDEVFDKICESFGRKPIVKDRFHLMVTLRYDPQMGKVKEDDMDKSVKLYNAIRAKGFLCNDDINRTLPEIKGDRYIDEADETLSFPQEFEWNSLNYLTDKCCASDDEKAKCLHDCENIINRVPMLSTKYACYRIFTFYREKRK
ncbi:MAG: hypothetical protein K2N74_01600 [Clostridiales bacterium]|nr:hypothetical protein [Clostridiales bacterium]